jgi:hypothetical protein
VALSYQLLCLCSPAIKFLKAKLGTLIGHVRPLCKSLGFGLKGLSSKEQIYQPQGLYNRSIFSERAHLGGTGHQTCLSKWP